MTYSRFVPIAVVFLVLVFRRWRNFEVTATTFQVAILQDFKLEPDV